MKILTNNGCTIRSGLNEECVKLAYCKKTGLKEIDEYKKKGRILLDVRTGLRLGDTSAIRYHHDKGFLTRYESLQKYFSDPYYQHTVKINSKQLLLFLDC